MANQPILNEHPLASPIGTQYSYDDYLEFESLSTTRHEYWNGSILAMTGGSFGHGIRITAIIHSLIEQLKNRPCQVATEISIRVINKTYNIALYPDITVVCGPPQYHDGKIQAITNPTTIIEVLSPSTERYDRINKLAAYRTIPSLREIIYIAHDEKRIDIIERTDEINAIWIESTDHKTIRIPSINCKLDAKTIYAGSGTL